MKLFLKILVYFLVLTLILTFSGVFWLYAGQLTENKVKILEKFPFPLATVNSHPVSVKDYFLRYKVTKNILLKDQVNSSDEQIKNSVYNQLIAEAKLVLIAEKNNVWINNSQVDAEYDTRAQNSDKEGYSEFETLIKSYGLTIQEYKNLVIKPYLISQNLKIWFNSQEILNQKQFAQARSIIDRVNSNEDMGNLAREFTQDPTGQNTKGDMGFLEPNLLIPEIYSEVSKMQVGELKLISSRYGLHIIKLEEQSDTKIRLREIFLDTENFDTWLTNASNDYQTKKLLPI